MKKSIKRIGMNKNNRKLILRADGGPQIGMGHFIRTLALGEMLKDDFYCIYATRNPSEYLRKEVNKVCDELIELPEDDRHYEQFLEHIEGNEIVVLDNYYFDTDYQQKIKDKGGKLVCIDDMHDKHYVADVVINHAEGLSPQNFSVENYTRLCLGYKYALLRKAFYTNEPVHNKKYDVLIGIGGADANDITYKVATAVSNNLKKLKIAVLIGNAYNGNLKDVTHHGMDIYRSLSADDVSKLMASSKIGAFPASTIAIEATAMRLPFLVGYFVKNQEEIYKGIVNNALGIGLGDFNTFNTNSFTEKFNILLQRVNKQNSIIEKQKKYLDKNAINRLQLVIKDLN